MLIIHHTLHNNRKKVLIVQHTLENRPKNEILSYTRMLCGQNRSARENKRKREISKDFSRFFVPAFFRISIGPFSSFLRHKGFELPKASLREVAKRREGSE